MTTDVDPVDETVLEGFRDLSSAVVADTKREDVAVLEGSIRAIHRDCSLVGTAKTTRVDPEAIWPPVESVVDADPGEVLVVDAGGAVREAVWGELLSTYAKESGVVGMITDGAVRDIADIRELEFPVFAPARTPRGPSGDGEVEADVPVAVGGTLVSPGDVVIGDETGVTVVDPENADAVLEEAQAIEETEGAVREHVENGVSLADAMNRAGM
ncbi:RraA family protein [Halopenitus salinus]|uniref:RraA family protein n=1 Tax=Halopenitus salinus TaxID=1198295 RepID=A0ABD5UZ02_9EURY